MKLKNFLYKTLAIIILSLVSLCWIASILYAYTSDASIEHYFKGIMYATQGKLKKAQKEFKKAIEIYPSHRLARKCLKIIEDALKNKLEKEAVISYFKGINYKWKSMSDKAIMEYKKAITINPNFVEAYNELGEMYVYCKKGMLDEAIPEFKKAITIDPDYAEAHYNLGYVYCKKGMLDEAIAEFKKAITIDPDYAGVHKDLGIAYYKKGMLDEAIAEFKKAITIDPDYAEAHYNLGKIYLKKKMIDEAIDELEDALKKNKAVKELERMLEKTEIPDEFEKSLIKILNTFSYVADAHYSLALAYYYKGQYCLAIKHCKKAIKLGYKVDSELIKALSPYVSFCQE